MYVMHPMTRRVSIIELYLRSCILDVKKQSLTFGDTHFAKRRIHRRVC